MAWNPNYELVNKLFESDNSTELTKNCKRLVSRDFRSITISDTEVLPDSTSLTKN